MLRSYLYVKYGATASRSDAPVLDSVNMTLLQFFLMKIIPDNLLKKLFTELLADHPLKRHFLAATEDKGTK